jgi:hypothetical protein
VKYETYSQYDPHRTALAESALLTVWSGLGNWRDELVLVGGLVPKYLCGDCTSARELPRPATLDVDFGIALAADGGMYGSLEWDLSAKGFVQSKNAPSRYVKVTDLVEIPVDFLVEAPRSTTGSMRVADVTASIMPGIGRALATARQVRLTGLDLYGVEQELALRVCEIGPFLALKLRAFGSRQQPKDAFDILYTVLHYDGGTAAAIEAFALEVNASNPACSDALRALETHFLEEAAAGPVLASHFVMGEPGRDESEDSKYKRTIIRQDMVDIASRIFKQLTNPSSSETR